MAGSGQGVATWPPSAAGRCRRRARRRTGPSLAAAATTPRRGPGTADRRPPARDAYAGAVDHQRGDDAPRPRWTGRPGSPALRRPAPAPRRRPVRPSSVKPARSISALPTPTQASRPSAATCCGNDADQRDRQTPQGHPDREPGAEAPSADQQRRGERTQDRARPDGSGEDAHARFAGPEQFDGDHHGEDGQRPAGE